MVEYRKDDNMSHNGWTNYATWKVNLELLDGLDSEFFDGNEVNELAESIKLYVEEYLESEGNDVTLDFALAFVADVNWYEIAEDILAGEEEVKKYKNLENAA
jgi:hypothetical protein